MNKIEAKRKGLKISQEALGKLLGVSQGAVSQWESGESLPRADKLPELAKILNCTVDDLLKST